MLLPQPQKKAVRILTTWQRKNPFQYGKKASAGRRGKIATPKSKEHKLLKFDIERLVHVSDKTPPLSLKDGATESVLITPRFLPTPIPAFPEPISTAPSRPKTTRFL
jgi:hypothetical protein